MSNTSQLLPFSLPADEEEDDELYFDVDLSTMDVKYSTLRSAAYLDARTGALLAPPPPQRQRVHFYSSSASASHPRRPHFYVGSSR